MGQCRPGPFPRPSAAPREYLTPKEVERLIAAARQNRYGHRDAAMIRVAYQHGLRVSELCALRWDQVDFWVGRSAT
jgi:type 1 fimbriae regulatory protein FimB/type 1 fimbriae regulatory protein FimE